MSDDLEAKRAGMQTWFDTTGFPLEFATREAMSSVGYQTEMGTRYEGNRGTAAALRETDVLGIEPASTEGREVLVVAECKHAGRPWLVRCQPSPGPEDLVHDLLMHRDLDAPLRDYVERTDDLPFFLRPTSGLGFGVSEGPEQDTEAARRQRDQPFAALQSVVAAARARAESKSVYDDTWLIWPIIVIEGELWSASPGKPARAEIEATPWQRVRWRDAPGRGSVLLDIVTKPALPDYLHDLRADTMWLANWMKRLPPPSLSVVG